MEEKIKDLLAEVLQVPRGEIGDDFNMKGCEAWDSLRHMDLIASIELGFGLQLTFDEIVVMTSVGGIAGVLRARGVQN